MPGQLRLLTLPVGALLLQAFGQQVEIEKRAADAVVVTQAHLDPLSVMVSS